MAAFINNNITFAGLLVLAKGIAGQKINYTRIELGDGRMEKGQTAQSMTQLISPKATVPISKLKVNGNGTVTVGGIFTNSKTNDGFYYRELGLYAQDPDPEVGEVLYCYGNCGDLAEWIPAMGGVTLIEKSIDIVTAIGSACNVTACISPDAPVLKEDLEAVQESLENHIKDQTVHVTEEEKQRWNSKGSAVIQRSISLATSGWTGEDAPFEQTVSVEGVTEENAVSVGISQDASDAQAEMYGACGVYGHAQASGQLTFRARYQKPSEDLLVTAFILG